MGKILNKAYLSAQIDSEETESGQVTSITEQWFVLVAFGAGINVALAATGLPANNSQHSVYTSLRVSGRSPTMDPSGIKWDIEIKYTLINADDPVNNQKLVNIEYGTHELQKDVTHNLGTGAVLIDANGKPFSQTIQLPRSYPFISINKKQVTLARSTILSLSGTINNAAVTVAGVSIPKHAGRIKILATETEDAEYPWDVSYEVSVRYNQVSNYIDFGGNLQAAAFEFGWDEGVINEGFFVLSDDTPAVLTRATELVKLSDGTEEERPTAAPVLLDDSGNKLSEATEPIVVQVQGYPEGNWSTLGLNNL